MHASGVNFSRFEEWGGRFCGVWKEIVGEKDVAEVRGRYGEEQSGLLIEALNSGVLGLDENNEEDVGEAGDGTRVWNM